MHTIYGYFLHFLCDYKSANFTHIQIPSLALEQEIIFSWQIPNVNSYYFSYDDVMTWNTFYINPLWSSGAIWWLRSGSTLAQIMACCLTVPNHYLNWCLHLISDDWWHSPESNFTTSAHTIILYNEFENDTFKITPASPRGHWVNSSQGKMAAISQTIFSDTFSWMKFFFILIRISLKFVLMCPIDDKPALVAYLAPSHYPNQCWPDWLACICCTRGRCINSKSHQGATFTNMS